jgi:hypothetical protein
MTGRRVRRDGRDREFGDVSILRNEPDDAAEPKAGAKPIDEMRQFHRMIGRSKAGLHRRLRLGYERGEPHHVEAKAGIAGVPKRREALGKQAPHLGRIAHRRGGPDLQPVDFAIGAKQRDLEEPCAFAPPLQRASDLTRQMPNGGEYVGFERDRIGKAPFGHHGWNRQARRDRLDFASERLV